MEDLPATEQASLQRAVFTAMHAVEPLTDAEAALPVNGGASHFTTHPGQNINARFLKDGGVTFASGLPGKTWRGTLRFVSSEGSAWQADATRAERSAGLALTEWYENRAKGLEHGFTLAARPAVARETGFSLDMALDGLFTATDPDRAGDLVFTDPATDQAVLAYRDLKVWDATGRELAAVMRPTGRGLRFTVRDEGAVYPVTIDPLIVSLEERISPGGYRKVTAPDPAPEGRFGNAVALAGDIALIGAPGNDAPGANGAGAVYVFGRSGDLWQFQQKLTASGAAAGDAFGSRIALDGNTAAISAPGDDAGGNDAGAVYLFERSGSSWTQGSKLVASNAAAGDAFGESVALSGGTLLVGAPGKNADAGAAYLFIRNGATWGNTLSSAISRDLAQAWRWGKASA